MMEKGQLKRNLLSAVEEYLSTAEAWDDAMVAVDTESGHVDLVEAEEADALPDTIDEYDIMDLVEMTPDGKWIPDNAAIESIASEY